MASRIVIPCEAGCQNQRYDWTESYMKRVSEPASTVRINNAEAATLMKKPGMVMCAIACEPR
jgi:hypothetical protein